MARSQETGNAVLRLWGHRTVAAQLEVVQYPLWAWISRVILFTLAWAITTALTLVITFDPFVASFPFVLGLGLIYHGIRGRYRVMAFNGHCPRCAEQLKVRSGSKINLPHNLTCFNCHFEPELVLTEPE